MKTRTQEQKQELEKTFWRIEAKEIGSIMINLLGKELCEKVVRNSINTRDWTLDMCMTQHSFPVWNIKGLKEKKKAIDKVKLELCEVLAANKIKYKNCEPEQIGYGFLIKISLDYVINVSLENQLNKAVEVEDYLEAAEIKKQLEKIAA